MNVTSWKILPLVIAYCKQEDSQVVIASAFKGRGVHTARFYKHVTHYALPN